MSLLMIMLCSVFETEHKFAVLQYCNMMSKNMTKMCTHLYNNAGVSSKEKKRKKERMPGSKKGSSSSGGKRTRPQLHQNTTAFHHNPSSKLTAKILASPISRLLCPACVKVIEWRKQYRKYKPLTVPKKCISCGEKRIKAAYHCRCDPCAISGDVCAKCGDPRSLDEQKRRNPVPLPTPTSTEGANAESEPEGDLENEDEESE